MKKLLHLIYIPVSGLGIRDFRGNAWYEYRLDLFKRFTLASLKNQNIKDFIVWCSFRKEEKENPITKKWEDALKES